MKLLFTLTVACGLMTVSIANAAVDADAAQALVKESGCITCHAVDKKKVGPSFKDVAKKYKGKADAQDTAGQADHPQADDRSGRRERRRTRRSRTPTPPRPRMSRSGFCRCNGLTVLTRTGRVSSASRQVLARLQFSYSSVSKPVC